MSTELSLSNGKRKQELELVRQREALTTEAEKRELDFVAQREFEQKEVELEKQELVDTSRIAREQAAAEQNALNNQHAGGRRRTRRRTRRYSKRGGYQYKQLGGRIVVPQSENAPPPAGPVDGNSLAVGGAENLTQSKENASYDDINAPPKVTTVAGGARRKQHRRKTRKNRKTRGKYGYNQRGCSKNGKKKSRRRTKRRKSRKFIVGGKRTRRSQGIGGYVSQIWGCFS